MKNIFPGHFPEETINIEELWGSCIFALDTNVLLNLYRYSDATKEKLIEALTAIKDRLWIPYRVAEEYLENRLNTILEQQNKYETTIKEIEKIQQELINPRQHPFVSTKTLKECNKALENLTKELEQNKNIHTQRITKDDIKKIISDLLESKVGAQSDRETLNLIIEEGKERYKQKIPPGYRDSKKFEKSETESLKEQCRPFGDLIIWKQIIAHSKNHNKPTILITDDNKEDWWLRLQGRTISPRPELIDEFKKETGFCFYMYLPDRFLELANKYILKKAVSPEAIQEIKEVSSQQPEQTETLSHSENFFPIIFYENGKKKPFGSFDPATIPVSSDSFSLKVQRMLTAERLSLLAAQLEKYINQDTLTTEQYNKFYKIQNKLNQYKQEIEHIDRLLEQLEEDTPK
ncbi:TPA: DUF4935 domain-containing protein [Pseudomonas aeruginosa]|nr:DUF4935 domain-containing protein [Pseudomonas aeruginosa]